MKTLCRINEFVNRHMPPVVLCCVILGVVFPDSFSWLKNLSTALFAFMTFANSLGGGAIGLIEAGLLVFLVIWVARRLGVSFETDAVAATHLLRFFTTNTPLSALSFLQ